MKSRIIRTLALATASISVVAAGCTSDPAARPTPTGFPVTVGSLTLDKRPERIISISPTATEMLFAIDAGPQVAAVDDNSNYPPQAPRTTLSGVKPNAEAIATYHPDLVVLSYNPDGIKDQLQALRIPTFFVLPASTLADTYREIMELGQLTGHQEQAQALVERMRADIEQLQADMPERPKPLTFYYEQDLHLHSIGSRDFHSISSRVFVGQLLASVGLVNIAGNGSGADAYPQLSAEVIIKADPDLIFLADAKCCGQSAATVAARPGWSGITAVRTGRVVLLDDDIASRWGPRVVELLRTVTAVVSAVPTG